MASALDKEEIATPEKSKPESRDEIVSMDLSAPEGWKKKFTPKKGGRNEIVFISPTGEEIKSKRQLEQYLKSHPGGHSLSEFNWGTGDTPRRSARISEKVKATETPEGESPNKRDKKSSAAKETNEKKDGDGDTEAAAAAEESKDIADAKMKEARDEGNKVEDVASKEAGANEGSVEQNDQEVKKTEDNPKISESRSDAKESEDEKLAEQKEKAKGVPPRASELLNAEATSLKETEVGEGLPEKDIHEELKTAEINSSNKSEGGLHPPNPGRPL